MIRVIPSFRLPFLFLLLFVLAANDPAHAKDDSLFTQKERSWLAEHRQMTLVVNIHPEPIAIWNAPTNPQGPPVPAGLEQPGRVPPPERFQGPPTGRLRPPPPPFPDGANRPLILVGSAEQGYFKGVAADYLEQIARLTGISFTVSYMTDSNFRAAFAAMEQGDADLLPAVMSNDPAPPGFVLTSPYIEIPVVVVMRADAPRLEDISRLETMDVAGVQPIQAKMLSLGLKKRTHLTSPHEGLVGVATGKYDAFIAELASISYDLGNRPVTNLKIVGELPGPSRFSAAVPERMKEFIPIFDKAVRAIPQEKRDEIWKRWFPLRDEREAVSSRWLLLFGAISLTALLLGGLGFFYYRNHLRKIQRGIAALEPHLLCVHTDRTITITGVTEALCRITGFSEADLVGQPLKVLGTYPAAGGGDIAQMFESVARGIPWKGEVKLVRKDGSEIWTDVIISPTRRKNDEIGYTVIYQDASRRKHYESLAIRDELTGLYNRRHFNVLAPQLLKNAAGNKMYFALFLFDVDNFKLYNDTYGHPAGDQVLTAIGHTLKRMFRRDTEPSFRLGGEEFGVTASLSSGGEAQLIAERLLTSVRDLAIEHRHNPAGIVTISIGSATSTGTDGLTIEEIYRLADENLYRAKESGKNKHEM